MDAIALVDLDWNNKELIEEGCFGGEVYKTNWYYTDANDDRVQEQVAVVNLANLSREQIFDERDRRSSLCNKKVVELLGWCQVSSVQRPMLVFEHSRDGDLWNYLHRDAGDELTSDLMKKFAFDIAQGMDYLHSNDIIHGDLAVRNCLVYKTPNVDVIRDWEVKVGDNGFYNTNFEGCYYNQKGKPVRCPVRWMAPENLPFRLRNGNMVPSRHKKSKEGDVWAFGVVLFEIWTEGEFPFGGLSDKQVCSRVLNGRKATNYAHVRLKDDMDTMWQTMHNCWQPSPKTRPKFSTIVSSLEECEEGCNSSSDGADELDYTDHHVFYDHVESDYDDYDDYFLYYD